MSLSNVLIPPSAASSLAVPPFSTLAGRHIFQTPMKGDVPIAHTPHDADTESDPTPSDSDSRVAVVFDKPPPVETKAVVFKPPAEVKPVGPRIFLAGSIEMGKARHWQADLTTALAPLPVTILNPRRDDWNSSWEQRARHPQFHEQVKWEMDQLDAADVIAMYFDPDTIAPISLLELGMYAATGKMVVCCPEKYHRLGNVEMVCEKYKVPLYQDWEEWQTEVVSRMEKAVEKRKSSWYRMKYRARQWLGW